MIAGLLGGELAHRRKDSKGIAGEHDDIGGLCVCQARNSGIGYSFDGICTTGVLGDADIIVVGSAVDGIVNDVLEDATEFDGVEDLRLFLRGKVDAFCVAATFNVEYTGVGPDVFVVTNKLSLRVSRKGGFACAGKTKEKGDVFLCNADVAGRVERELAELHWLKIVLHR